MARPPSPEFCACCDPREPPAPASIFNRPGLSEISWRLGSYATFRQAMIEAIATGPSGPDDPRWLSETRAALTNLTSRDDADYAIMLVDLFAAMSDVLAFYSERFANEFYLRTARERDSLLRLVRLIGYRFAPGTGATTALSFLLDPGASARIRSGLKVMSVPGQDEAPQTFETISSIIADARLNDLPLYGAPIPTAPFAQGMARFPLTSRPDPLLRGDTVAIWGGNVLELHDVRAVDRLEDGDYLTLARAVTVPGSVSVGFRMLRNLRLFGHNVPASFPFYNANPAIPPQSRWTTKTAGIDYPVAIGASQALYALDAKVDDLKPGALLLADLGPGAAQRYALAVVDAVENDKASLGPLADTVTWVRLRPVAALPGSPVLQGLGGQGFPAIPDRRRTRLFELARPAIVPRPYVYPPVLSGSTAFVRLPHIQKPDLLARKRRILIVDPLRDHLAAIGSLAPVPAGSDGVAHLQIGFAPPLPVPFASPRMNANVAPASHGETQPDEPLGHGDANKIFQSFRLQRKRVTRLPSATGVTPSSEFSVRVNGELWEEVPSFFGRRPTDRIYTIRDDDDGNSIVTFGDGRTGSRLPSGANNVVARYRTGLGAAGRVRADQLTTLLERAPGLRAVTNPLAAEGGADPETLFDARRSAPATVRTFGRAISLQDFEDVARQTGLAARARATWAWIEIERAIQLTVAGEQGARLSAEVMKILHEALGTARDPNHSLILGNLWRVPVIVKARILRDPRFEAELVLAAARDALLQAMAFEVQPLGRALHLSQIVAALQSAKGVKAVDVDRFHIKGAEAWTPAQLSRRGASAALVQQHIRIFDARPRPAAAMLDPVSLAGLALDPDARALPAEQAFIANPATDLTLGLVEAL